MRKIALHIASLIVCLGIFANTSAAALSSLPLELKLELTEEITGEKELIELSESIIEQNEALVSFDSNVSNKTLIPASLKEETDLDSSSKGSPNKLHIIYESYLI